MKSRSNRLSILRIATLLLTTGTAALAWADTTAFNATATPGDTSGEDLYSHICQGCHMPHGEGAIGAGRYPKLAGDPTLASWQYVALTVLGGRKGMPAFSAAADQVWDGPTVHLSDAQVAEVVNYVRSHFGNTYKEHITASQVATLPHPTTASAQ